MKKVILVILAMFCFVSATIPWVYSVVKSLQFDAACGDYLKLAADANDIDTAEERLSTAIEYLKKNDLDSGYTKIFIYYPKNNIAMWYENLKTAQVQLQEMQESGYTELEQSNMLMKLRETILDENGSLTHPEGISMADNYTLIFWLNCCLWIPCLLIGIFLLVAADDNSWGY